MTTTERSFLTRAGIRKALEGKFKEHGYETEEDFALLYDEDMLSDEVLRHDIGMRPHEIRKLRAAAAEAYAVLAAEVPHGEGAVIAAALQFERL